MKKGTIWTIVIILIILVGVIYLFSRSQQVSNENLTTPAETDSINVKLQDPNSVAVVVDEVSLREAGFVVIHADNNGTPGDIIASSRLLQPGTYKNVSVIMAMTPGTNYHAMLHKDNGNGIFSADTDLPVRDSANAIIMTKFLISDSPFVEGAADVKG